jgi:Na+-driven multidrug efflux pump
MYSNITATVVHVALCMILTVNGGMGLLGVAIASSVQFAVRFIMTYGYVRLCGKFDDPAIQVPIFHVDSLRHWKSQFFLSL